MEGLLKPDLPYEINEACEFIKKELVEYNAKGDNILAS